MPSVRYFNQSGPFWDFISDLENQGQNHPIFAGLRQDREAGEAPGVGFPWSWAPHPFAQAFNPEAAPPYDPEQAASGDIPDPPTPPAPEDGEEVDGMFLHGEKGEKEPEAGPHRHRGPFGKHHGPHGHHGPRGWEGARGRGGCGARGRGGFPFGRRGGPWAARGGFGGPGGPFNLNAFAQFFQEQFIGKPGDKEANEGGHEDFKPLVDVFDTESAFILHVSLPGVKKEDVAVTWDAEKSELSITGVAHRPGDEEFLKTLALDERQVGAFERKVRLGSRANPAQVEVEGITAKLEDGILRVEVPKEDKDYVDVKKVDIE